MICLFLQFSIALNFSTAPPAWRHWVSEVFKLKFFRVRLQSCSKR